MRIFYPSEHAVGLVRAYRKGSDFQSFLHSSLSDGDVADITISQLFEFSWKRAFSHQNSLICDNVSRCTEGKNNKKKNKATHRHNNHAHKSMYPKCGESQKYRKC